VDFINPLFLKKKRNKCQYNTRFGNCIARRPQVNNKQYNFSDPVGKANSKSGWV